MKDINPIRLNEGHGIAISSEGFGLIEGNGVFIEGVGLAIDLNEGWGL